MMRSYKVWILGPSYEEYGAALYQQSIIDEINSSSIKSYHCHKRGDLCYQDLLIWSGFDPDFIIFNHGWLSDDSGTFLLSYSRLSDDIFSSSAKTIIFLNKEYANLEKKVNYIKQHPFDLVISHLHTLQEEYNLDNLMFVPFAVSSQWLNSDNLPLKDRQIDLYFSGVLRNPSFRSKQSDIRLQVQNEIFYTLGDFPLLKRFAYRHLNIYWKPFYKSQIKNILSDIIHGPRLSQSKYISTMRQSKCVFHSASPMGIISNRIFEVFACSCLGIFHSNSNANVLFKAGHHFIEFLNIDDFKRLLSEGLDANNINHIQNIASTAHQDVLRKHKWKDRISAIFTNLDNQESAF